MSGSAPARRVIERIGRPGPLRRVRAALLLSVIFPAAACHTYVPARPDAVEPGREVRVRLSEAGAERLEDLVRGSPDEITGEFVEGDGEIVVSVRIPSAGSAVSRDLRQRVVLSSDEVSGVSVRELDRFRTAAFAVSAVAVATTAVIAALSGPSGGSRDDPGPPETEEGAVLPAWSDGISPIPLFLGRSPP